VVALTEDFVVADDGWCDALVRSHASGLDVTGSGIVNISPDSAINWAVFLAEYGRYAPPSTTRLIHSLSGLNVSYSRALLDRYEQQISERLECWKFHRTLRRDEIELRLASGPVLRHFRSYSASRALWSFFHHGRSLAGSRFGRKFGVRRVAFAAGSVLLPFVMSARIVRDAIRGGLYGAKSIRCLPATFLLATSWAAGEFAGYVSGPGGSPEQWK
jgi:hypothetical protein